MTPAQIILQITTTLPHTQALTADNNTFFFYNPNQKPALPADHKFPYLTLVTNELYDQRSNLARENTHRLNISLPKQTFQSLFPKTDPPTPYDFTTLNQLMPHPIYAAQYWTCILNPTQETFQKTLQPLLLESHHLAASRQKK